MKKLSIKFILTTFTIMIGSALFAFMLSNFYYQQKLKQENDEKFAEMAINLARSLEEERMDWASYLEGIAEMGYQLYVHGEDGRRYFFGDPFRNDDLPQETVDYVLQGEIYHGIRKFPHETFVTGFFANELTNTVGVSFTVANNKYALFLRPNIQLIFREMRILLAVLLSLIIVFSIFSVFLSARFLVQPITKLTDATQEIAKGNFSLRLEIDRQDEIGKLATHFTKMAKQLKKLDRLKNELIANISHDIQTPLANMRGYAELIRKETLSREERKQYAGIITEEVGRLSNLTKQLILLTSLDRPKEFIEKKNFSLSEQMKRVIRNHQWLMEEKGMMVSYVVPDVEIFADESLLQNVWENLLGNAIKYSHENGSIHLLLKEEKKSVFVFIEDQGIGIPPDALPKVFDRFYRVDPSRTRTVEGTGLGLAITKEIVQLHGGKIEIESKEGKGTKVIISLPKL